ncbi:sigma 54-interacting transcriptional regulator [Priestia aryabhattai]|uniref:sigma 54-interacting transcriptional regulator n=1 Tax=Priestia aryabhattai TaxID=412384 RepID=UPI00203B47D6|nr:sigma 54-interacting transcriptional regulator [Priestia aryabhattai]MCM3772534.1 sigma 54-interacting transcriptional regulator [Priestia aryabhattai]
MAKIAFIAPDKQLFLQGKKVIQELGLQGEVEIYLARLNRAVKLANKLECTCDVIVCRGGTARLITDSVIRIPVVEIPITGQDLAHVFYKSKQVTNIENPKVAMLAFQNMKNDVEILADILGINLSIYPLDSVEDIPTCIEQLSSVETDIVIGGMKTTTLSLRKGFKAIPIESGNSAVRTAFLEAKKISLGRKIEKERSQTVKALIDYSIQGIISINRNKTVEVFNHAAEHLLELKRQEVLGKQIDTVMPFLPIKDCFEGEEHLGIIKKLKNKSLIFNIAPIRVEEDTIGAMITFQDITSIQEMEVKIRGEVLSRKFETRYTFSDILGHSKEICEAKRIGQTVSSVNATVLIYGESGTGKELFAQSIHAESLRKNGPFVAVNCAAIPPNLLESELFGYVEGAFTGATRKGKQGLFEMAHRGTIFLDEISEMDTYGQSRLLRVLQEKQVMRLGDNKYIPVDVRVIAATNKNLLKGVEKGEFREDLLYRLKVLTINIPPLRKRKGDIRYLAQHFLVYYMNLYQKKNIEITEKAYSQLTTYEWKGNVRELMHFIERLVVISKNNVVSDQDMKEQLNENAFETNYSGGEAETNNRLQSEKEQILLALTETHSNISQAAKLLEIDRSTLYRKLRNYGIEIKKAYK